MVLKKILYKLFGKKDNNICKDKSNQYYNYPNDLKLWCENRDKYFTYWEQASTCIQNINENYSQFINNNLSEYYFSKLLLNCNTYIKLKPILDESIKKENEINNTNDIPSCYNIGYHKLAMAYEKLGQYQNAINICKEAIKNGYTDDKTKYGFQGRIKRLENKILKS